MHPDSNAGSCDQAQLMPQVEMRKPCISRQRYSELVQLALRAAKELTDHGLQRSEYCEFGRIMDKIMQLD